MHVPSRRGARPTSCAAPVNTVVTTPCGGDLCECGCCPRDRASPEASRRNALGILELRGRAGAIVRAAQVRRSGRASSPHRWCRFDGSCSPPASTRIDDSAGIDRKPAGIAEARPPAPCHPSCPAGRDCPRALSRLSERSTLRTVLVVSIGNVPISPPRRNPRREGSKSARSRSRAHPRCRNPLAHRRRAAARATAQATMTLETLPREPSPWHSKRPPLLAARCGRDRHRVGHIRCKPRRKLKGRRRPVKRE